MYREVFTPTTTILGAFNVNIGTGTADIGTFANINWGHNAKFMQVEMDPAGGTTYTDMGTQQMMSVPYALNAGSIKLSVSHAGDTLFSGAGNFVIVPGISAANATTTTTPTITMGMSFGGGIVAYILQSGDPGYDASVQHGLIAAPSDQSTGIQWYNGSNITTGASGTSIGTGLSNTNAIISAQGAGSYAAMLCHNLTLGGYTDWYLPSKDELNKLYLNKIIIGGFVFTYYWSSSEFNFNNAWFQNLGNGDQFGNYIFSIKNVDNYVRAVRSF